MVRDIGKYVLPGGLKHTGYKNKHTSMTETCCRRSRLVTKKNASSVSIFGAGHLCKIKHKQGVRETNAQSHHYIRSAYRSVVQKPKIHDLCPNEAEIFAL